MSPVLDLSCELAKARERVRRDPFASADAAARALALYVGSANPSDPRLGVLDADLSSMPSALIQVGSREMLIDDSRRLALGVRAAGSPVDIEICRGQIHVFQTLFRLLPEARYALQSAGAFLAHSA